MNSKGTTLMETLTAIFILSIAGLMITTGFVTVIRVTNEANEIKNQSDNLLSYAESTDNAFIEDIMGMPEPLIGAVIKTDVNGKGNSISLKGQSYNLEYKNNQKVSLRKLEISSLPTVYDQYSEIFEKTNEYHGNFVDFLENNKHLIGSEDSYNVIFNKGFVQTFLNFPKEVLPEVENDALHVLAFYPWDRKDGNMVIHDNSLLFLSTGTIFKVEDKKEPVHFIYDTSREVWYFQESNDYVIDYNVFENFDKGISCIKFKEGYINSSSEMSKYLNSNTHGWKKLYKGTKLNTTDSNTMWQ